MNITPFAYDNNHEVRTLTKDGEIWWVAKDVCDVLDLNIKYAKDRLDDDEMTKVDRIVLGLTPGKSMVLINEPGLYSLILRSRKPQAKPFKRWVTHDESASDWLSSQ